MSWAVIGTLDAAQDWAAMMPVRLSLALLQSMVGLLLMLRPQALAQCSLRSLVLSLPSFLISGLLFRLAMPLGAWPIGCKWAFAACVAWVMACFWNLRHSFAIFPARRAIVRTGLYRLVRHPAYLGEYAMACACALAGAHIWSWACLLLLAPLLVLRIVQEEQLLLQDTAYAAYAQQTRWRLLPWLW
jgi:protein-S-isoprenylcysteine O-methyltransferase Ste14